MAAGTITAVRDALASLARSFKRVSVYRHAPDQHLAYLEPAAAELRSLLDQKTQVTVSVEPTALLYEGEMVHTEPARETGFCYRLHRDGVRTLTFRRGFGLEELLALAHVAIAEPQEAGGREDAVTELWKADLKHIGYSASAGYRMDESGGEGASSSVTEVAGRVQEVLDRHLGASFAEVAQQPVLWSGLQRAKGDPVDYAALGRRAAHTILRIVEQDYAGRDQQALQETFWRLIDQMLEREQAQAIGQALDRLRRVEGAHAGEFRQGLGAWLADPARLERAVKLAGAEKPPLLGAWLQLLPPAAGPALLAVLPMGRDPAARLLLAKAAVARMESCAALFPDLLRKGSAPEARAVLGAMAPLPPLRRAELAGAAFENQDPAVRLEAIPLVAADHANAVKSLGAALGAKARAVRVAAAQALAGCTTVAEQAAALLLEAMARPLFAAGDKEERTLFYRSLGKLGSSSGFSYLVARLSQKPKKIFGRQKLADEKLLVVQGLAEDGSGRALRTLEDAALASSGLPATVVAACKAAAQYVRTGAKGGKIA
jgi:hypothetical protein